MKKIFSQLKKNRQTVLTVLYAVVLFSTYVTAVAFRIAHLLKLGIAFAVLLVIGIVFISAVCKRFSVKPGHIADRVVLSRSLFDSIDRMDSPVIMCHVDGRLIWCNESFRDILGDGKKPYGKNVSEILGVSVENIRNAPPEDGLGFEYGNSYYIAKYSNVKLEGGGGLIILTETSEYKAMSDKLGMIYERLDNSDPVVAYVLVDNLAEMIENDSNSYRPATARVDEIIREWAADTKGVIKEFERDRYIVIFEKSGLKRQIERKFDILEKIRDVRVGAEQLSVTLSVGISSMLGSFSEKDQAARAALELALSRGGDQIVVKTADGTEFYGGRVKSTGRRNSVRSRVVSNELLMHMARSSNVIIMGHRFPDYDSIAAAVGIARLAIFCGVDVNIIADEKDINVALCRQHLESIPEYRGIFTSPSEGLDLMETGTFVVVVDVNNLGIVEDPAIIENAKQYAVIDHHRKTAEFKHEPHIEYIEPKASSASELVCEMLEHTLSKDMLTKAEADLLLAGIMLDTNQFTRNTGARTYSAALYLHDNGAEPQAVQELFKSGLEDYLSEGRFRSNVVIYRGDLAITMCEESSGDAASDKIMASRAAEGLIGVRGINAAFALINIGDSMHISARSTGKVNVQLILEKLDGGGHFDNAGAQLRDVSPEEAVKKLKDVIDAHFAELKKNEKQNGNAHHAVKSTEV